VRRRTAMARKKTMRSAFRPIGLTPFEGLAFLFTMI